jgi:recombination protein RecA
MTRGALALAPLPTSAAEVGQAPALDPEVISTGFPELDAILRPRGLPREVSAAIRGDLSSGKTTLALRCVAEAQADGAIAAYLDLGRTFDPREAVARGVDLRWLLLVRPTSVREGLALAGALLAGRSVDLLLVDLPSRVGVRMDEPLRRLAAHARRSGARLIVLEPTSAGPSVETALAQVAGLRLELERRAWLRLGRDVVGQRTSVVVAKDRYGPPGRRADLDIHYPVEGEHARAAGRFALPRHPGESGHGEPRRVRHLVVT